MQCPAIGDGGDEEVAAISDKVDEESNYVEKIMDEEARQNKPRKSGKRKDKMNFLMKGDKKKKNL